MTDTVQDQDFQTTLGLAASQDTVFEALTTTGGVSSWWGPATGSASIGGDLEFMFGEHLVRFRVTVADRPTRVRWHTVDCDVMPDWVGTTIAFDLSSTEDGGTTLYFRHAGLVPQLACYEQCSNDWGTFLHSSLVSYLQTGTGHPVGSGDPSLTGVAALRRAATPVSEHPEQRRNTGQPTQMGPWRDERSAGQQATPGGDFGRQP